MSRPTPPPANPPNDPCPGHLERIEQQAADAETPTAEQKTLISGWLAKCPDMDLSAAATAWLAEHGID